MRNNAVQRCDYRMHDIIDGSFRVERVLGTTSTDQKFKVIDENGKEYILKLLKLWEVEPYLRQNMLISSDSEIKSCKVMSNYLTTIVGEGIVKGNPYILTEYSRSSDLSRFIGDPKLNIIKTAKEILFGLRDFHKSGKVHCQLTPENIIIEENGGTKITNYVILGERCKVITSQNRALRSRFVDKSLAYMAPELYRIERCSTLLPTIDIFSFGVILFQLLTGELPFGKLATESDWIHYQSRAKNNDWNKNILLRSEKREMWMNILDLCLCADANDRVEDVDQLLELLPQEEYKYKPVPGSSVDAPKKEQNGILLHIMQGIEFDKCYRLSEIIQPSKRIITIGRTDNSVFNMIQLSESSTTYISRRHCTIEYDDESKIWYLRDGQWDKEDNEQWRRSLNGTYINSREINQEGEKILPGDIISIGDIKLRVEAY